MRRARTRRHRRGQYRPGFAKRRHFGSLLSRAVDKGIGFSRLIATGNEADLDVSDFIDYLVDDDATKVIALYLEGLRSPQHFRSAALRAAAANKQIIAFKVGRSESGIRSAISHTGALAGIGKGV